MSQCHQAIASLKISADLGIVSTLKKQTESKKQNLAAIDIGSNAIRMVIARHTELGLEIRKKYRFPIRLGADVFKSGEISGKNLKLSARTFRKFKEVTEKYQVSKIRAVATSALREAKNKQSFVDLMFRKSKIAVEIIDGIEEAKLIYDAVSREVSLENHSALLVDIGGGSVELTCSRKGAIAFAETFPFGTVRTLQNLKKRNLSEEHLSLILADFVKALTQFFQNSGNEKFDFAVGTGGNLEALGKLKSQILKSSVNTVLTLQELNIIIQHLQSYSIKDRIEKLGLREDRADVILPAALLVQLILRQASIEKMFIPHVGLKDGILWGLI